MKKENDKTSVSYVCYRVFLWLVKVFYPKIELVGMEHIPEEPCVLVGNHTQMHGPICAELYIPGQRMPFGIFGAQSPNIQHGFISSFRI